MTKFIVRDLLLATLVIASFLAESSNAQLQTMSGLGIGLIIYLTHEWSHYVGAVLTGANLRRANSLLSPFIFSFDSKTNSRKQFIDMSWPGFASTFSCLVILYIFRPDMIWAEVAWTAALALTAFTVIVEGPIFLWALIKREIPPVEIPLIDFNSAVQTLKTRLKKLIQ